jgi:hypothetical protein
MLGMTADISGIVPNNGQNQQWVDTEELKAFRGYESTHSIGKLVRGYYKLVIDAEYTCVR